MSNKAEILHALEVAGKRGIHSFQLLSITPRYAARIHELIHQDGYEISSEPERGEGDAIGVRYKLVGSSAGKAAGEPVEAVAPGPSDGGRRPLATAAAHASAASTASSESAVPMNECTPGESPGALGEPTVGTAQRSVPSCFDPDVEWEAA